MSLGRFYGVLHVQGVSEEVLVPNGVVDGLIKRF